MPPTQDPLPPLEQSLSVCPKLSRTDLEYLREWMRKEPHLPQLSEAELVPFLHSNEYSLERTKVCIDKYFTMRTHAPELFRHLDLNDEAIKNQLSIMYYSAFNKKDVNGNRIIYATVHSKDATHYNFDIMTSLAYAYLDIIMREDPTCPGYVFIVDSANATFGHLAKLNISSLSKSAAYFQEALPLRMKAIHFINVNSVAEAGFQLTKPFLGEELQRMIHFHSGSMEKFYQEIPKDVLPKELGGSSGSLVDYHNAMVEKLRTRHDWLLELQAKKVDESKRPGQDKSTGDVFGMAGSFKKLDID